MRIRRGRPHRGFTLIELMIVVAIIGLLAAIAIPSFLRFQLKSKSIEGKTNLAAIRTAQETYYSEYGAYVSASASPAEPAGSTRQGFVNTDGQGFGFSEMGWAPEGMVYFNYGVEIDTATPTSYTATAGADIDADGTPQRWGYRKGPNPQDGKDLSGGGTCAAADLSAAETVQACDNSSGQSVF